jgi:isopentenyl diphosphate isomerase/L-lactate dehydrogenase-like FMN-dependent dehydrogenase
MSHNNHLLTVSDYETRSRELFPPQLFEANFSTDGGRFEANTRNIQAFNSARLRPRVLVGVGTCKVSTTVLGQNIGVPVMIAPAGVHQRAHPDGELATARAAASAGTVMVLSQHSTYTIEEVAEVATGSLWFQLYFLKDRAITERLVLRAEEAGYKALMVTVDHVGNLQSEHQIVDASWRVLSNFAGTDLEGLSASEVYHNRFEWDLNWSDLEWLRARTSLPLVVKGIQTAEDAELCREHGVNAIVVSNHGGHALPDAKGTLETLPEVVDSVRGELEVYMDGGVRRGSDVLKALALGARAVFIGRPLFWGLRVDGERGVLDVLNILRSELESTMRLCGVTNVEHVSRSLVSMPASWDPERSLVGVNGRVP